MIKVVLLGAGNVATHLFEAFKESNEVEVVQVYNRTKTKLKAFTKYTNTTNSLSELENADVYIISVNDDAIESVSNSLILDNRLIVHTSGSVTIEALKKHKNRGVFYPLQSFTKNKEVDFTTVPMCLETALKSDYSVLETMAKSISKSVYSINSNQRKSLHVAAVFVNNFVNHLYHQAHQICKENDVPFKVLHPLLLETAQKAIEIDPKNAQTGPAKRNDNDVIQNHIQQLPQQIQKEIYSLLTKSIQETYGN